MTAADIFFVSIFLGIIALLAKAMKPGHIIICHARQDRYRTIQRLYIQNQAQRRRTIVIDKGEHLIVGDGAWKAAPARYPESSVKMGEA